MLAGLLYAGAALGLLAFDRARTRLGGPDAPREARFGVADLPAIAAMVVAGGMLGPVLMLTGLRSVSGTAGSLLLNLEAPFTILLATALFGEHLGARQALGALAIVAGAALLSLDAGPLGADLAGTAAIAGACLCWALDTNLSQRLSFGDPVALARIKTSVAGAALLLLALASGERLPPAGIVAAALVVGGASYGVSLVLAIRALRILGSAREAAYFAVAPFIGAVLSIALLRERPTLTHALAALSTAGGVALLLWERHAHPHTHEALEHEHLHVHDEHHRHAHPAGTGEPHSHPHRHAPLTHTHAHFPDVHHRHRHG